MPVHPTGKVIRRGSGRYRSGDRPPAPDWDVRILTGWGVALVLTWILPLYLPLGFESRWVWPWTLIRMQGGVGTLLLVLWPVLGVALVVAARRGQPVTRGWVALGGSLGFVLLPLLADETNAVMFNEYTGAFGALAILGYLGLPAMAAGNRVYRRHAGRRGAGAIAAAGGLAVLALAVVPSIGVGKRHAPVEVYGEAAAWKAAWPFLLWFLGALCAAGLAVGLLARPAVDGIPRLLGRMLRGLMWGGPVAVLLMLLIVAEGRSTGPLLLVFLKQFGMLCGVVIVMAVGAARLLQGPDPAGLALDEAELRRAFE